MRDALLRAGKVVELVAYQKVYHRFDRGPASRTGSERTREGYTYQLDEKAREDAWARTLAWLRK
jgi:dienelactone hydrolase